VQELKRFALDLSASLAPAVTDSRKTMVKSIISRLAGSLSTSMPSDAKHRQHLSCLHQWLISGRKKKGLKMDCAGLTLAVFCITRLLSQQFPILSDVRMVVRFRLCSQSQICDCSHLPGWQCHPCACLPNDKLDLGIPWNRNNVIHWRQTCSERH
jgi:hypothetical protein